MEGNTLFDPWQSRCRRQDREKAIAQCGRWLQDYYTSSRRRDDELIHNVTQAEIDMKLYFKLLNDYKVGCSTCTGINNRLQRLTTDMEDIKKIETFAICDHCLNTEVKCKRCEYVLGHLTTDQKMLLEERHQRFKCWIKKTKNLLEGLLNSERVCRGTLHRETFDAAEFENLLQELKTPLYQRRVEGTRRSDDKLTSCKNMLRELITISKMTAAKKLCSFSESSDDVSKIKFDCSVARARHAFDVHKPQEGKYPTTKDIGEQLDKQEKEKSKLKSDLSINKSHVMKKGKVNMRRTQVKMTAAAKKLGSFNERSDDVPKTKLNCSVASAFDVHKPQEGYLMTKDIVETLDKREKEKSKLKSDLAINKSQVIKKGKLKIKLSTNMNMRPDKIEKKKSELSSTLARGEGSETASRKQLQDDKRTIKAESPHSSPLPVSITKKEDSTVADDLVNDHGIKKQLTGNSSMFYQLSDRKFIDMGWTQMPTSKVMRRMNVYKMEPISPSWFDHIEEGTTLNYITGETLASVQGRRGKLYYKNGTVALDYYNDEEGKERLAMKPYVIYSYEEDPVKPQTVLACFDRLGNGIVYDSKGNERLKYNQSEGSIIDPKLGAPSNWKWHVLNDPPVLQNAFIDTYPKTPSPELEAIMKKYRTVEKKKDYEDLMISIELQKYEKEAAACKQKYIPFEIKMKAVKINEYFSLRLFEQANIYLQFRHDEKYFKLNLGMKLLTDEIIGSNVVEAYRVVTPYIKVPSASHGLRDINKMLKSLEAFQATNENNRQFDLNRQFYNVFDSDPSNTFASPFRVIHLW